MPEVRFSRVEKRYGSRPVVRDFSLTIQDGEFFTLVGPSGCGKSTVLNLVAGLEPVSSGEIYFDDRPITHFSPKDRDVAMVFQSYALYPHKTVFENLAFPLRIRKRPVALIESEVQRVAGLLGLDGLLAKKPAEISGGERQRVALGRALIREPVVFLMDEPLSNLDAHLRVQTRAEIKRLHARLKTTTLYVTHDQEEALSLSDRIAVLKDGAIQQVGTAMEIYRCPANTFVAQFVGSPQINLLPGRIASGPPPHINLGSLRVPLSPAGISPAQPRPQAPERDVLVGIRPEDIRIVTQDLDPVSTAVVVAVELAGARSWVELRWSSLEVRALAADNFPVLQGQVVGLKVDVTRLHLFDPRSGRRMNQEEI
jgi:multiple sugar transport system ATP-binding protein